MLRLLARIVLAAIGGAMLATAAFAHATLLDSDPAEDQHQEEDPQHEDRHRAAFIVAERAQRGGKTG